MSDSNLDNLFSRFEAFEGNKDFIYFIPTIDVGHAFIIKNSKI